jgi:hypothetical protein
VLKITLFFVIVISLNSFSASGPIKSRAKATDADYSETDFKDDWSSPFKVKKSKEILLWGSAITATLVVFREGIVEPLQENISEEEPLGEFSKYGDLLGRMVPNLAYIGYQWKFGDKKHSNRRIKHMFKTSVFAGGTIFFLKRIFNERRPHKGDRNSFPSGHTTTAFAFSTVIALEHPSWAIPAYAMSTFVGLSRMNDNAHYLHDVTINTLHV